MRILTIALVIVLFGCFNSSKNEMEVTNHKEDSGVDSIVLQIESSCINWESSINDLSAQAVLVLMESISSLDWNYCYSEWECRVVKEKYEINAGGWIRITEANTEQLFGCKSKSCWELFLSEPMCDSLGNSLF